MVKEDIIVLIIGVVYCAVIIIAFYLNYNSDEEKQKDIIPTQYIQQQRDSIKLKVTTIDSLQHEKVIEVQGLSNDSTLELFYKLIGK